MKKSPVFSNEFYLYVSSRDTAQYNYRHQVESDEAESHTGFRPDELVDNVDACKGQRQSAWNAMYTQPELHALRKASLETRICSGNGEKTETYPSEPVSDISRKHPSPSKPFLYSQGEPETRIIESRITAFLCSSKNLSSRNIELLTLGCRPVYFSLAEHEY